MTWESFGLVGFDLRPLLQGQTMIGKVKVLITCLLLVLEVWDGKQPIGYHDLGIFWSGRN